MLHPRTVAVSETTLFVLGDAELAAFDLREYELRFKRPIPYGSSVHQIAVIKNRLYVGDRSQCLVHVLDADNGAELKTFAGSGAEILRTEKDHSSIGVAATRKGSVVVSDSFAIREFTANGDFVRTIARVRERRLSPIESIAKELNTRLATPEAIPLLCRKQPTTMATSSHSRTTDASAWPAPATVSAPGNMSCLQMSGLSSKFFRLGSGNRPWDDLMLIPVALPNPKIVSLGQARKSGNSWYRHFIARLPLQTDDSSK